MRTGRKRDVARCLRRSMTDAERRLWFHLRNRSFSDWKFRRQHPVGPYIADFACLCAGVVVEVDGGQHLESAQDDVRTRYLHGRGLLVLRFWNDDVLKDIDGVCSHIVRVVETGR